MKVNRPENKLSTMSYIFFIEGTLKSIVIHLNVNDLRICMLICKDESLEVLVVLGLHNKTLLRVHKYVLVLICVVNITIYTTPQSVS